MDNLEKILIINATAIDSGGALSILKQVIEAIPENNGWSYIIYVSPNIKLKYLQRNIYIEPIKGVKSFTKRFLWDTFGIKKWLRKNNIKPTATLSLQNTNFRTGYKIPNYVYLHQSIPFYNNKWSILNKEERILWFYKNIYPFFIKLYRNKSTIFFVQLDYIKQKLHDKFKVNLSNIYVIKPLFRMSHEVINDGLKIDHNKLNLFYPSSALFYKNHNVLFEVIRNSILKNNFMYYFTIDKDIESQYDNVNYLGSIKYEQVIEFYSKVDALVFPSYIESYGLPLLEAASYGLPIIVSDLPYSREVLKDYEGAIFVNFNNIKDWENAINNLEKGKKYNKLKISNNNSWNSMFQIINNNIK